MAQRRQIIYISQVSLSLLHSLHTAVDGPHQSLLSQTLKTTNNTDTQRANDKSNLNTHCVLYVGAKL